jgi:hypothetical protein
LPVDAEAAAPVAPTDIDAARIMAGAKRFAMNVRVTLLVLLFSVLYAIYDSACSVAGDA